MLVNGLEGLVNIIHEPLLWKILPSEPREFKDILSARGVLRTYCLPPYGL